MRGGCTYEAGCGSWSWSDLAKVLTSYSLGVSDNDSRPLPVYGYGPMDRRGRLENPRPQTNAGHVTSVGWSRLVQPAGFSGLAVRC
ncbi:hypothetical protein ACRALDRAFT_2037357 [Sodiomyces alcalophilus JCM 7366]|uniref:uncharacterized protein n=1 Tax=Sodiomyces alcalophilus JCM 7366 TaxID=591952 RepID=UPI0039B49A64